MSTERIIIDADQEVMAALMSACKRAGIEDADGRSTDELARAWGVPVPRARDMIRGAKRLGVLKVGRRADTRIDGSDCSIPVYSFDLGKKKVKK